MSNAKNSKLKEQLSDIIVEDNEKVKINFKESTNDLKIDDSTLVRCKSNVFGKLIYVNNRTGEVIEWDRCGDVQELSLSDLRAMKAGQASFFINQWIIILGVSPLSNSNAKPADIYRVLGIVKYYTNIVEPANFEEICGWNEREIEDKISLMSDNSKEKLRVAISEYIIRGLIDSKKIIKAFGKALNTDFE